MTPAAVHYGRADELNAARRQVLLEAHRAHPERFVHGTPQPPVLPRQVWINPPPEKTTPQEALGATFSGRPVPELVWSKNSNAQQVSSLHLPKGRLKSAIAVGYVFQLSGRSRDGLEDHAELHLRTRG